MPILLEISITCNQGSTGKISEQIGNLLQEKGWEVYLAHGARRINKSQLKVIPFSSVTEEYCHALLSLLFDKDGLGSVNATRRLIEKIKIIKPDVIHIHNLHGYYLNYKLLFEYLNTTNIPVVMTLHDCWAFTGHCVHFVTIGCEKWKKGCCDCVLKNKYPKKTILFDRSQRNYQLKKSLLNQCKKLHIATVSEWLGDMARQSFLKGNDVRVIPNGVDINVFKPLPCEHKDIFRIIAVANVWHKDKGFYDIINLSKYLRIDENILLVGHISNKQKKKLPSNIIAVGLTASQEELANLYNESDVVVSMSYAETFGLTIAEGMACGLPAVVYNNTSQPELITEKTGYVVENGNVKAVYEAIQRIKKSGRYNYTMECRKYAKEHFDKNKCFEEYVKLYYNLLNK